MVVDVLNIRYGFTTALLLCISFGVFAQARSVERVPTRFTENGRAISLELVVFRPNGAGPFPTIMFNHGSTGTGTDPARFTLTWTSDTIARFFNERGWMVVFPQRRGRGQSGGRYDEGFERDRSRYSCSPPLSLAGVEHAIEDLDEVIAYLGKRADVDAARMVIGGQSRGGILAIAYAGERPKLFKAAINFSGGWMSEGCPDPEAINTVTFRRGAKFPGPTLWLYADADPYYTTKHNRKNFDAFVADGGRGEFQTFSVAAGQNAHRLIEHPALWTDTLAAFIDRPLQ